MSMIDYTQIASIATGQPVDATPVVQCFNDAKAVVNGDLDNNNLKANAAIAHTKLASITAGSILMGGATNIPTATAVTGDIGITSAGVVSVTADSIVNADIKTTAAIATTKMAFTAPAGTTTFAGSMWGFAGSTSPAGIEITVDKTWTDFDCDTYFPGLSSISGKVLAIIQGTAIAGSMSFRPNGTSWNYDITSPSIGTGATGMILVATDADHIIEYYADTTSNCFIYIVGYIGPIPK